jgi:glycosyltransferase involved in cell wall biosynthesis/GT2 family glycosyltransferase
MKNQLSATLGSRSWRWTKPFRWAEESLRAVCSGRRWKAPVPEAPLPKDFRGNLEQPPSGATIESDLIHVTGWVFDEGSRITALTALWGRKSACQLRHGISRPDVRSAFPQATQADLAGFEGFLRVGSPSVPSRVPLVVEAELQDGRKVTLFERRIRVRPPSAPEGSTTRCRGAGFLFLLARRALLSIREGKVPRSWREFLFRYHELRDKVRREEPPVGPVRHSWEARPRYERWLRHNAMSPALIARLRDVAQGLRDGPLISVVVPVYNTPPEFLRRMAASVLDQIYPRWELCVADDASTEPHVRPFLLELARRDERVKAVFREANGHIAEATNSALDLCTGEYVLFLDHDDELPPDALLHIAERIHGDPGLDWIYADEDKIDAQRRRYDPQFKGGWSPEMALTHNYTHHPAVIRRSIVEKAGRMRRGFEGAQDLDLFLRVAECTTPDRIAHVPYVCYHWRAHGESTASDGKQKGYVFDKAREAIRQTLERRGLRAEPFLPAWADAGRLCLYQLKWDPKLIQGTPVTIVIPTRDRADLLRACIASLERTVPAAHVRLIVVDDRSSDPGTLRYLAELPGACRIQTRVVRPRRGDGKFNFARLINEAAEHVETPAMLLLNNDVEAMATGWLEDMVGWLSVPGVGAVGARLVLPDGRVQHAGVAVGPLCGLADHLFSDQPQEATGYLFLARVARNVSAVTAACMLVRTESYKRLGGVDEERFAVAYNDVDFCLRLWKSGERVVYTPQATLLHQGRASRGVSYDPAEHSNFIRRHEGYRDPFFNPNLETDSMAMAVHPHHIAHAGRAGRLNTLLLTHNLNLEGAPIFLLELATYLKDREGFSVQLLSPEDGPLSKRCEERGIPVRVLDEPILSEGRLDGLDSRLERLAKTLPQDLDVVLCNTLLNFWGVELARLMGKASIWYVHESTTKHLSHMYPATLRRIEECFAHATRVSIPARAAARMHHPLNTRDNVCVIPNGIPLERIDAYRKGADKRALRRKHDLPEEPKIVLITGTTLERKGQHVFVSAAERLLREFSCSARDVLFLIVGGKEGGYLHALREQIDAAGREAFRIVMETPDIYDFYALSDIFVCASNEECFPLVVLEAMAFELPIVSTDVYGIPEIITDWGDGLLVGPARDEAMAERIHRLLRDPDLAGRLARHSWHTVHRKFDSAKTLSVHARLCREAVICHGQTEDGWHA